jgi:hypothetical protein
MQPKLQPPAGLNLLLGESPGGIFNRNYGRQSLLVDNDVLSCGPTPRCADFAAWNRMRREYWEQAWPEFDAHPSTLNVSEGAERLRAAERINLWVATSVSEQLFVAFTVHVLDELGIDATRLHLLQFEQYRDKPEIIVSLGHLNEANLAAHPEPVRFTADMVEDYRAAWSALTAPEPAALEAFAQARPQASPWLTRAIRHLLRRFPDRTGLTWWDRSLLAQVRAQGPKASRVVAQAMVEDWDEGDCVGDIYLLGRLRRLAQAPRPLVIIEGNRARSLDMTLTLTDFGQAVLDGRESSFPANPIDDWAAGVRLCSRSGQIWFNEGGKLLRG